MGHLLKKISSVGYIFISKTLNFSTFFDQAPTPYSLCGILCVCGSSTEWFLCLFTANSYNSMSCNTMTGFYNHPIQILLKIYHSPRKYTSMGEKNEFAILTCHFF